MKDFIYQINKNECGFACIKMLLASLYKDSRYLYLPHKKPLNEKYTLLELKDIAKEYGLVLSGYIVKYPDELIRSKRPYILVTKLENGNGHCVLVKKSYKKFSYIYDPAIGKKLVLNSKLFSDCPNGFEVLQFEGLNKMSFKYEINDLISFKNKALLMTVEVLAILSYFIGAYFVDQKFNFIYPIIFVVVGVLFAVIYKSQAYIILKKFDDDYIRFTYDPNLRLRRRNYLLMHKTKSGLLTSTNKIVLSLSSALAVNTILILQNYYSIFVLLSSAIIVLIDYLLIVPIVRKRASNLEYLESNLLTKDPLDEESYLSSYQTIKEKTYKIAGIIDMKKMIEIFILLIVTFFMSAMTNNANIYFVLFYFAMCLFTFTSLDNAFLTIEKNKENIINQTKFYELIVKNKENESE